MSLINPYRQSSTDAQDPSSRPSIVNPYRSAAGGFSRPVPNQGQATNAISTRPTPQTDSADGDFMRGLKRTLPELKQLAGGTMAAIGDVTGWDSLRDKGLGIYKAQEDKLAPLQRPTDSASEAWKQVKEGNLGAGVDFLQNAAGYTAGQALESVAAAGAGAVIGGIAGSEVPVAGNVVGGVLGGIGGFVGKQALKRGVKAAAEDIIEKQVAKGVAKDVAKREAAEYVAENTTKKALADQVGKQYTERQLAQLGGRVAGGALGAQGLNTVMEVGSVYPDALQQAHAEGRELTDGEKTRALLSSFGAAGLESAADLFNLGVLFRGVKGAAGTAAREGLKATLADYGKRAVVAGTEGALREAGTEGAQTFLERYGANQSLDDADAWRDYIDSAAVGAVGGVLFGAGAAAHPAKAHAFGDDKLDAARANYADAKAEGDPGKVQATAQALATELLNDGRAGPADTNEAAPAPAIEPAPGTEPAKIKFPEAETPAAAGTMANAANVLPNRPAGRPLNAGMFERQLAEQTRAKQQVEEQPPAPPEVSWADPATGELRQPTDDELKQYLHDAINAQSARGIKRDVIERALWENHRIPLERTSEMWKQVTAERKTGLTAPAPASKESEAAAAEAAGQTQENPLQSVRALFKQQTGEDPEAALVRRAQVGVRNDMRDAGNLDGEHEADPYTPEQSALLEQYQAMKNPSSKYLFHTTTPDRIESIAANGLQPNSKQRFEGVSNGRVSLAANEATARYYGTDGDVMLRVRKNYDPGDLEADHLSGEGAYTTGKAIPPDALEVKQGRKWVPLTSQAPAVGQAGPAQELAPSETTPTGSLASGDQAARPTSESQPPPSAPGTQAVQLPEGEGLSGPTARDTPPALSANQANEAGQSESPLAQSTPAPDDVHAAAHEAATSPQNDLTPPTPAQLEAGNFKVGRIRVNGLDISIEHPAGVKRNPKHSRKLKQAYGYIRRTEGADGEKVDVFLGDHAADTTKPVFVIDQKKADGSFDEHKAMLGFDDEAAARAAYLANYPKGWEQKGLGGIRQMSQDEFKAWVQNPEQTKQPAVEPAKPAHRYGSPVAPADLVTTKDVHGQLVRVAKADLDNADRTQLVMYGMKGQPKTIDGHRMTIHRDNLDQTGEKRKQMPGLPYYAHTTRKGESPFKTEKLARAAVTNAGQALADYEIREHNGGFVAVRKKTEPTLTEDGDTFFKAENVALYSRAPAAPFRQQVEERLKNSDDRGPMLDLGRTHAVLRLLGFPDLPLRLPSNVLLKVAGGKGGTRAALTAQQIAHLPELIDDPVAIFQDPARADTVIVQTALVDADGMPVQVEVRRDGRDGREQANIVLSAFGRVNIADWVSRSTLLYRGDKANPRLPQSSLDQRQTEEETRGSGRKVLGPADLRNFRAQSRSSFSKTDDGTTAARAGEGLDRTLAQRLLAKFTANWGENAPNIVLVDSAEELQQVAGLSREVLKDPGFYRSEGLYNGKKTVWLNLAAIHGDPATGTTTEQRFGQVLAHEARGHFGVEQVIGKAEWKSITETIWRHVQNGTGVKDIRDAIAHLQKTQPEIFSDPEVVAKEVIAVMAERGARNGLIDRVVTAVRRFLRQIMPSVAWSDADIRGLLSESEIFLRRGRTNEQQRALARSYAFSRADDEPPESGEFEPDTAFVAGLTEKERKSPGMAALAQALYADLGIDSPFFRDWFGDSKVTDADGEPVRAYHGTNEEFTAFDTARLGKGTNHMTAALGIFFDTRKAKAEHYARLASNDVPAEQVLLDGYLSIQKPYSMSKDEFMSIDSVEKSRALRDQLQREGYDGIKLPDIGQWVAFDPTQFKLADNRGTFDRGDARMLFSKAPAVAVATIEQEMREVDAEVEGDRSILGRARAALQAAIPKNVKDATRTSWLGALGLRHLVELGSDYFPTMKIYGDYLKEMEADRNQLQQEGENVAEAARKWAGKNLAEAGRTFDLMHDATILGVDPAEDYKPLQLRYGGQLREVNRKNVKEALAAIREQVRGRAGDNKTDLYAEAKGLRAMLAAEPKRKAAYPDLVARWNQLSDEAKAHYVAMRDIYAQRSRDTEEALVQRIKDLKMEGGENHKRALINQIRMQFESQRLQGVYFPLQRFGQYFVAAEKGGTPTFQMFESLRDLEKGVKALRARGFTVKAQGLKSQGKAKDAPSGTFVAEVIESLRKAHVSEQTQDQIYQIYLQTLPELSMRKHSIHRQSILGFDTDALRAFAFNMTHGAHQLARLRYAHKLSDTIDVLKAQQEEKRKEPDADTRKIAAGDAVLGELEKRHAWISNPTDSKLSNLISSFGFTYYLGLTPAAALVNLTQTALITFPYLAARHGPIKAMNSLLAGMTASARTLGHIQRTLTDPDELRAHAALQKMGALDKTQTHNLAGIAEGGLAGYNPKWATAMKWIGIGFHTTEVVNREATGIAAFRLARAEGKSFDEAVKLAADAIHDTHYDYSNANRARFMQNGTAKVLLMFRQYSLNTTWHLGRMVWNATKGADPEVKRIARRNLAGVLGMSALFSGALGLPLMSATMGLLNAIAASAGDDDEPWDAETEFRAFLIDMFGEGPASVILNGAANPITGADIASRVSMSQLWFRDADRELDGEGAYYNLLEQAAGPMGGVLKNALVGKQLMDEGHLMRGVETVLPKSLKDMVKAGRYATQGANNLRGDPIVADLSLRQVLLQLGGFTPSEVADRYDRNRALKNYEQAITNRRQYLMDAMAMAVRAGDQDGRRDAQDAIRAFNQKYHEIAITPASMRRSLRARARYSQRAEAGIVLNPKLAARVKAAVDGEG